MKAKQIIIGIIIIVILGAAAVFYIYNKTKDNEVAAQEDQAANPADQGAGEFPVVFPDPLVSSATQTGTELKLKVELLNSNPEDSVALLAEDSLIFLGYLGGANNLRVKKAVSSFTSEAKIDPFASATFDVSLSVTDTFDSVAIDFKRNVATYSGTISGKPFVF